MNMAVDAAVQILLGHSRIVGIELAAGGELRGIHNAALLSTWLDDPSTAAVPDTREALFNLMFGPRGIRALTDGLARLGDSPSLELGILAGRLSRAGTPERQFSATLHRTGDITLLVLQDDSRLQGMLLEQQELRDRCETSLSVLRAPPDALRLFLSTALASVHAIRATLRLPARTQEALRDKLGRLRTEAESLGAEASAIGLSPVAQTCQDLQNLTVLLQAREPVSGDDLLPLAPRVDLIASAIGNCSRIEEQRYEPPLTAAEPERRRARRNAAWHDVSERRWGEFLRRRGQELGSLARLVMTGAQDVPQQHRRHVDEILQHLLRNAMDHGIETPEERLDCHKSASGHITVSFSRNEQGVLKMTVHDDGRGFDMSRIGRAAVQSGLLSDESLQNRDAADLVGLIFKPTFTTEGLAEGEGQGRGMSYLRRKITRMGGQISVATKAGRYTLFTIELPESESSDEGASLPHAMP
jgi:signal transduction histidine kinase